MFRAVLLASLLLVAAPIARAQELTVFAAASLTDALRDLAPAWEAKSGGKLRFNFAASSTLARQIEQGAPANLFASADEQWMDWAANENLIVADTRRTLLGNELVLVVPRDRVHPVTIGPGLDLLGPARSRRAARHRRPRTTCRSASMPSRR